MTKETTSKPHLIAYHVRDGEAGDDGKKKGYWTRIGAAWRHEDNEGANIVLDLLPIAEGGQVRIVLRAAKEKHIESAV